MHENFGDSFCFIIHEVHYGTSSLRMLSKAKNITIDKKTKTKKQARLSLCRWKNEKNEEIIKNKFPQNKYTTLTRRRCLQSYTLSTKFKLNLPEKQFLTQMVTLSTARMEKASVLEHRRVTRRTLRLVQVRKMTTIAMIFWDWKRGKNDEWQEKVTDDEAGNSIYVLYMWADKLSIMCSNETCFEDPKLIFSITFNLFCFDWMNESRVLGHRI